MAIIAVARRLVAVSDDASWRSLPSFKPIEGMGDGQDDPLMLMYGWGRSHKSFQCQNVIVSHIKDDLGLSGGCDSLSGPKGSGYSAPGCLEGCPDSNGRSDTWFNNGIATWIDVWICTWADTWEKVPTNLFHLFLLFRCFELFLIF